jgi:hypothetical protein
MIYVSLNAIGLLFFLLLNSTLMPGRNRPERATTSISINLISRTTYAFRTFNLPRLTTLSNHIINTNLAIRTTNCIIRRPTRLSLLAALPLRTCPRSVAPAYLPTTCPPYLVPAAVWSAVAACSTADGWPRAVNWITKVDDALCGATLVVFDAAAVRTAALVYRSRAEVWVPVLAAIWRARGFWRAARGGGGRFEGVWNAYLGLRTGIRRCRKRCTGSCFLALSDASVLWLAASIAA